MDKGQQGYAYNKNNRLLDAAISATIAASSRAALIYSVSKKGNGNIAVRGDYSGADDGQYDVKIVDSAFSNPVISSPVFRGAGTGKIRDIAISGLDAQKVRVLCLSTGIKTQTAEIEIEGVRFRAKAGGAGGNNITITIDDSSPGLLFSDSTYSTVKDLLVGATALEGQEWDWDTKTLQGAIVPDSSHRIAFGSDQLHIYRQYKNFENGSYKYYFIMPIGYAVKAGTKVYFVTGGRTITIASGATSEVYTGIVTIADLWSAVRNTSSLIEPIDNAIDLEATVDSPALRELSIKTVAYNLPPYAGDKSSAYAGEFSSVVVNANTKTELLQARCTDNQNVGAELWSIAGSVSGYLGQAITGDYNEFGPVGFTIPQKFPDDWGAVKEDWSHDVQYISRGAGINPPPICFAMALGVNFQPQTITLEYKKKPLKCDCPPVSFSQSYLGYEEKGGEIGMAYTVSDLSLWTDGLMERMREAFRSAATQSEGEGEATEGRDSASAGSYYWYLNFSKLTREYFALFKTIAQRIVQLPENDVTALGQLVTDYKALATSLTLWAYNAGSPITATWSDSSNVWSSTAMTSVDDVKYDLGKYQALVDSVLLYEKTWGVKKNSVISSDDGAYLDSDSDYYWEVRGSKAYLPAFTDIRYYSTVKSGDKYVSTKEFALNISVPCGGSLLEGDKIVVTIGGVQFARTYQVGDITYLPTVAAQALQFAGGITGDDTYVFEVRGDIDSFANYCLNRNSPAAYSQAHLGLTIDDGIIMFQVGDQFEFAIEGGHFEWRKDGGSWSNPVAISADYQTLGDGLEIAFTFGVSPSFELNDQWEVICVQENRVSNLTLPWDDAYKGTGNIVVTFATAVTVDTLIIDNHDLTGTVRFQASNVADFSVLLYDEVLSITDLICRLYLGTPITAKYFRLVISGTHSVGYVYLGSLMQLSTDADVCRPYKRYKMSRQDGIKPFSLYDALRKGYEVGYTSFIRNPDYVLLDDMINYLKEANDMSMYFIPNVNYPGDAIRGLIDSDNVDPGADKDMNMVEGERIYNLTIPILGI